MHRLRLSALFTATLVELLLAAPAAAHFGADSFILVPDQDILPGGPFNVIVSDLGPDSVVSFELRSETYATSIGGATAGSDGHVQTTLTMPADAPLGYIELVASSPDGTSASTWILVGPRTSETGPSPNAPVAGSPIDPSLIVMGVLLGGTIGAVGYVLLRRQRTAGAGAAQTVPGARTRVARKPRRKGPKV